MSAVLHLLRGEVMAFDVCQFYLGSDAYIEQGS
jgi:hypothetical protein